ncbi:hypothetical protein [Aliivibrio fischeri]|uniref:hypothetical protein n=1 Tax=Aliivibrio fischeri TaxID=668 RepID=UPI0007C4D0F5|nr:hypothetical protein [Aliivibrio fischeri]
MENQLTTVSRTEIINKLSDVYWGSKSNNLNTKKDIDLFEEWAEKECSTYLHKIFGNTVISLGSDEFWIQTQTAEQASKAKAKALEIGFRNVTTFIPKIADPNDKLKTINDPNHAFAVRISQSESLIFGLGQNHLDIYKESINTIKKHVIYTYAHDGRIKLTLNDKKAADIFKSHMDELKKLANDNSLNKFTIDVKIQENTLDSWDVSVHLINNQ